MNLIRHYFPNLSAQQLEQFARLPALYADWNEKINVISRQDIENLEVRHVLHSLALAKFINWLPNAEILDLGTGGGMPGIPLAILYPQVQFTLVDSIGKKIRVVQSIAAAIGLNNVQVYHARVEKLQLFNRFDFVVSRGVAPLSQLMNWSHRLYKKRHRHTYPNGLLALKGGNLREEIAQLPGKGKNYTEVFPVRNVFPLDFFEEKYIVYIQA